MLALSTIIVYDLVSEALYYECRSPKIPNSLLDIYITIAYRY